MLKATRRSAVLLAIVAIGMLAVSMPSFAEVQNIKIGGDETFRTFYRSNLALGDENDGTLNSHNYFLMNTLGLNVDANLTENVSVRGRITNEHTLGITDNGVFVSQAYATIKDLFYSPFTLKVGTFPVQWGRGFVLGSSLIPSTVAVGHAVNNNIDAQEFTDYTAFSGAELKGEFGGTAAVGMPLSIDLVYLKLAEGNISKADDTTLMGVNLGTRFENGEAEIYFLNKRNMNTAAWATATGAFPGATDNIPSVSTIGLRGSAKPVEGANAYGELAYQFGQRDFDGSTVSLIPGDAQQAWGVDLGADYTFASVPTTPKFGAEWVYYSGKDSESCNATHCGGIPGWDPIARSYFTSALRDFQTSSGTAAFYKPAQAGVTGGNTNQHQLSLYGSMKPLEDLTIAPRLSWYILDKGIRPIAATGTAQGSRQNFVGMEFDTQMTYNYTDDVQFGVIYGLFAPGTVFRHAGGFQSDAQELVSTVSVKF